MQPNKCYWNTYKFEINNFRRLTFFLTEEYFFALQCALFTFQSMDFFLNIVSSILYFTRNKLMARILLGLLSILWVLSMTKIWAQTEGISWWGSLGRWNNFLRSFSIVIATVDDHRYDMPVASELLRAPH